MAYYQGHYVEAEEQYTKCLARFQELGDKFWAGRVLNGLGELARLQGHYERAGAFYEAVLEALPQSRGRVALRGPIFNLAWVSLHRGDHRKAKALFEESFKLYQEHGNKLSMMECIAGFAAVAGMTGKPQQAARLFSAVEAWFTGIGMAGRRDPSDQKEFDHYVAVVREELDEAGFAKAWEEGSAMTMEQAIEFALQESNQ